ncbi:head-tail adaptor protein [Streptomyces sp. NPDC048110]|uniref:phage head completion protein n=1 Tax=Streptomyces sp. NPDC048110 TaxID=3155483 RepID=UPI0033FD5D12
MIGHWLNRELEVWRPQSVPDGHGGETTTDVRQPDPVRAKVDQPTPTERLVAAQTTSRHSHTVYLLPTADVRRGDELRDASTGERWRVLSVVEPSSTRYRKAEAELTQGQGETSG